MAPDACAAFMGGAWVVVDRFEDDDGPHHLDLYIGLQNRADVDTSPRYVDQVDATVTLGNAGLGPTPSSP